MRIRKLVLKNFRNIAQQEICFSDGVNILTGDNAQGKTNIIEALWLFSAFKSFRTTNEKDFIQYGSDFARLDLTFEKEGRTSEGVLKYYTEKRREIFLNGIRRKPGEMLGTVLHVMFFPEHLNLIKEGPEERRKFIDFAVCQLYPYYFTMLSSYNKTLFQRNHVLKSEDPSMKKTLDVWDEKLATLGAKVYGTRRKYIRLLEENARPVTDEISGGKETLSLVYRSFTEAIEETEAKAEMKKLLEQQKDRDLLSGFTGVGPHKDNLDILLNGRLARLFGSQGQQRSAVMAMKLAETEIIRDVYGEAPVLLFDDVFSELDRSRKEYIVSCIRDKQVIVTSCEEMSDLGNAKVFDVRSGKAEERDVSSHRSELPD